MEPSSAALRVGMNSLNSRFLIIDMEHGRPESVERGCGNQTGKAR